MKEMSELTMDQLLAIVLKINPDHQLIKEISARYSTSRSLHLAAVEELLEIKGVGPQKALFLKAVLELGYRIVSSPSDDERPVIQNPKDVFNLLHPKLCLLDREHFFVVFLNIKNRVLGIETISIGSLNQTIVHPRELFRNAIKKCAASVILVHNHPSGDPEPSSEDVKVTERILKAGEIVGINVLDHIVCGDGKFSSFKELGLI